MNLRERLVKRDAVSWALILACGVWAPSSAYGTGPYLYVAAPETSEVVVLDPGTGGVVKRIAIGDPRLFGPCGVLASGDTLFVVADCGGSEIAVINVGSWEQEAEIHVDCCTTGQMTQSTDGSELYVITEELGIASAAVVSTHDYSLLRVLALESVPRSVSYGGEAATPPASKNGGCQLVADRSFDGHGIAWIATSLLLLCLLRRRRQRTAIREPQGSRLRRLN